LTVLNLARNANTDGWGNKLVTIFARHLDNFILTNKSSLICQIRDFGSGQIMQPGQFYLSPGFAKIAPWRLVRRDKFLAKAPGQVTGRPDAANVYSLNRRAVRHKQWRSCTDDNLKVLIFKILYSK
jgi:hypothetical protein